MTNILLPRNLASILRAVGLKVVEIEGWETRGRPASTGGFAPAGCLCHHTGADSRGWDLAKSITYAKWMTLTGRSDLPAPLANFGLTVDGVVVIQAAGRCNHAGKAKPSGTVAGGDGNRLYIGIEAMNSGSQGWSVAQRAAYVTLCAVLSLDITGNSANTVRGHKETSTTGKWDPGLLDMNVFRKDVTAEMARIKKARKGVVTELPSVNFKMAHFSGQFSDSPSQWAADANKIFSRGYDALTGTEIGEDHNWVPLRKVARSKGYAIRRFRSNWVAIKKSIIKAGTFEFSAEVVAKAQDVAGPGHDNTLLRTSFVHKAAGVGRITVLNSHYPTRGWPSGPADLQVNKRWTEKLAHTIGKRAKQYGAGRGLVFYAGDQNIPGRVFDSFYGEPLTSCWNELKKWPNTGHGSIDLIASYDKDARVKCIRARAFTDKVLPLHSDHFLIQATYSITRFK